MQRFEVPAQTILVETERSPGGIRPGQLTKDGQRFLGAATLTINELQVAAATLSVLIADLEARVDALENP